MCKEFPGCSFSTCGSICLKFFRTVTSATKYNNKKNHPVFVNIILVFLLVVCANSLPGSFPCKYMIYSWTLIWSNRVWGSWYFKIWLEKTVQSSATYFCYVLFFQIDFGNLLFEILIVDNRFQNLLDLVILKKYQLLSNKLSTQLDVYLGFQFNL